MGLMEKVQDKLSSNKNHSNITNPGTHQNTNASCNNAGLHQTTGDKVQNAVPGQHGNAHDAHGNPVDLSGPGHITGSSTHVGGPTDSSKYHQTSGGLAGNNTHNTHNGLDNRGIMDKAKDTLSSKRTNQPDDPVTGTNYDQTTHSTSSSQYGSGVTGNTQHQTGSGLAGSTAHNTHNIHTGPDNRGLVDKAKDAISSKRSNQPDNPATGTNYDQKNIGGVPGSHNTHNRQHGSGLTGSNDCSQTDSGLTGSSTHISHNTHHNGPDNRGLVDKAKDAISSKRSNQPDDPVTGTNFDQKNTATGMNPSAGAFNNSSGPNY